jgi:hypothetical protein
MKQDQINELKTYYTPELKKIGTVKELTQAGSDNIGVVVDPENDNISGPFNTV